MFTKNNQSIDCNVILLQYNVYITQYLSETVVYSDLEIWWKHHNNGYNISLRPTSQIICLLSIVINRAEHVCAAVNIKHNYMVMCHRKIVVNIMLCLVNSTGHTYVCRDQYSTSPLMTSFDIVIIDLQKPQQWI